MRPDVLQLALEALANAERQVEQWRRVVAGLEETGEISTPSIADLLEECVRLGIRVVDGRYVRERDAATLVGKSRVTLRNLRQMGEPIAPVTTIDGASHYDLAGIGVHRKSVR